MILQTNQIFALLDVPFPMALATEKKPSILGNALVLLLPLLGLVKIELVGELFVHEVILILLFPVLLIKRSNMLGQNMVKIILLLGLMWFGSQVATDIFRETPPEDYLRGWAKISFFLISFASLVMLLTTPLRVFLWIAASVVPMFLRPFQLFANDLELEVLWKFGVGAALLFAACLPSLWKVFNIPSDMTPVQRIAWLHIIFGCGSFFLNARSMAGLSILTGILLFIFIRFRGSQLRTQALAFGMAAALVVSFALVSVYSVGASSGFFGEEAQWKYELQNAYGGGPLSVLLGGRSESLVSTQAIADSPFIGHGSWAKDFKYLSMYIDMRRAFSEDQGNPFDVDNNDGLIPSHSYLLGAWVEAGILGGAFWAGIILLCVLKVVPAAFEAISPLSIYVLMTLPLFLWNVLFSPFGAFVRVETAGILAIYSILIGLWLSHAKIIKMPN